MDDARELWPTNCLCEGKQITNPGVMDQSVLVSSYPPGGGRPEEKRQPPKSDDMSQSAWVDNRTSTQLHSRGRASTENESTSVSFQSCGGTDSGRDASRG